MPIQIRETTIEQIKDKIDEIQTLLNKIAYLESALKENFTFEIKKFIWQQLASLYAERKMYEKAARAMQNKAGVDITFRDKMNSYLEAAEMYAKAGKLEDANEMFIRASRSATSEQKFQIRLAKKNIYLVSAHELEKAGKKATALKFYEQLIKLPLNQLEKQETKQKLIETYKALGKFREAGLVGGL